MTNEEKDRIASRRARARDRDVCRIQIPDLCRGVGSGVHHIFPRADERVRWHLPNLLTTCGACHEWAHANPDKMLDLVRDALLSAEEWDELNRRRGQC